MTAGDSMCAMNPSSSSNAPSLCQECQEESFRYQCPRCAHRTCSLKCCVAHKKRTGCSGKRDRTKFLPVAHMNDGTLTSDYHFLEDMLGAVERAKRTAGKPNNSNSSNKRFKPNHQDPSSNSNKTPHSMLQQIENLNMGNSNASHNDPTVVVKNDSSARTSRVAPVPTTSLPPNCWKQLGPKWRHFWEQANLRGTNLLMMPSGMQRRKANSSHIKKDIIYWKVDVRIHSISSSTLVQSRKICEQAVLWDELQKIDLSCLTASKASNTSNDNDNSNSDGTNTPMIHWLIQKLPSPSNRPCYVELCDKQATLQSILKGMTLIEYPTIEVVPESRSSDFPRAIEEVPGKTTHVS